MLRSNSRAVVVVAGIRALDTRIGLQRQRAGDVRERVVSQPSYTVVVRLTRVHLIAWGAGTGRLATVRYSRRFVVPGGEKSTCVTDRKAGFPLGLGSVSIAVQLERSAECHPHVSRADIKNVTGVAAVFSGIDVVHDAIVGRRLAPAHVSPVSGIVIHGGEVTRSATTRADERGARVSVGPSGAAVR